MEQREDHRPETTAASQTGVGNPRGSNLQATFATLCCSTLRLIASCAAATWSN
jgi:hypothetical protein